MNLSNKRYVYLDLETHNAGSEYGMTPREFIRLGQYAINDGQVVLTTDYNEILEVARSADYLITHNGISSDMSWLFGHKSIEALQMALEGRVLEGGRNPMGQHAGYAPVQRRHCLGACAHGHEDQLVGYFSCHT